MVDTAALIGSLIREEPLCRDCLVAKSQIGLMAVEHGLVGLGHAVRLHHRTAPCSGCGKTTEVVSVDRRGRGKRRRIVYRRPPPLPSDEP